MNRKQICRTAVFLLILLLVVVYISNTLMPKWLNPCYETITFTEFSELDENSVEVCVLGSSQIIYGVSGMQLYEEHGISSYSFGSAVQPMAISYAWLQECMKKQDLKLVVLDVSSLYQDTKASQWRKALDTMPLSAGKLEAVGVYSEVVEEADPAVSFLLPLIKYHTRWSGLKEKDFATDPDEQPVYRGYYMEKRSNPVDLSEMTYDNDAYDDTVQMLDYQKKYLDKIADYCREQGLELLLIKTPKNNWNITKHTQVQAYADEKGLPYIDFSSLAMVEELDLDMNTDFFDGEHMNLRGAQKLTAWLGNYISEHYELADFGASEGYDELNYAEYKQDALLYTTTDIEEYFANLKSDRYEVMIQYMDDAPQLYSQEIAAAMQELGVSVDLTQVVGQKYVAWLSSGECAYEEVTDGDDIRHPDTLSDGTEFYIYSNFNENKRIRMVLDDEDVLFSKRGIQILVYNHETHQKVDTATIYYDEGTDSLKMIKEIWQ